MLGPVLYWSSLYDAQTNPLGFFMRLAYDRV